MAKTEDYKLKVTDTQKERRNFPGYKETTYYSLEDMRKGDSSGTTDTDSKTDTTDNYKGYTDINKKSGKEHG